MSQDGAAPETTTKRRPDRMPKPARPQQRLLKGPQVEMEYGPPYRTIYDWYVRGQLPAIRINRTLWFDRADIERLIQQNKEVHT